MTKYFLTKIGAILTKYKRPNIREIFYANTANIAEDKAITKNIGLTLLTAVIKK